MKGKVIKINEAATADIDAMYALMDEFYDNMDRAVFERDFYAKDYCIILRNDEGRLVGFTTQKVMTVTVDGREISAFGKKELTAYRRTEVGFVFQFYNLIPNLTALENVEIAAKLSRNALNAKTVLEEVGLKERAGNFPAQLSGGEQQRVAIARALAKNPKLLLCDEPTGALDYNTGKAILKLLQDTSRRQGMTVIIITHNKALCDMADRVIRVRSGTVQSVTRNEHARPIDEIEW